MNGRLHSCELQELCTAAGHNISEDEGHVALQAISSNENAFIDFSEFVAFWVSLTDEPAAMQPPREAAK